MEILTIAVQKGGTGKSTTAAALAQAAAYRGRRVLVIDCDPQANASLMLGADMSGEIAGNTYNLLLSKLPADKLIQTTEQGIDVIAGSWDLATVTPSSTKQLQQAIKPLHGMYDYIIIDTPPTAGILQYNALQAANSLIIPLQADILSLQAMGQIAGTAATLNKQLQIKGIILTQHNDRSTIAKQMQQTIIEKAATIGVPYLGAVRSAVAIREAQALQQSLYSYAPNSKPAQDYLAIFDSI